jgi:hypothetical protein
LCVCVCVCVWCVCVTTLCVTTHPDTATHATNAVAYLPPHARVRTRRGPPTHVLLPTSTPPSRDAYARAPLPPCPPCLPSRDAYVRAPRPTRPPFVFLPPAVRMYACAPLPTRAPPRQAGRVYVPLVPHAHLVCFPHLPTRAYVRMSPPGLLPSPTYTCPSSHTPTLSASLTHLHVVRMYA